MKALFRQYGSGFTDDDKEKCIPTIKRILELAVLARREGILALEEEVLDDENIFLRIGFGLVVDGTMPKLVKRILRNFILSNQYQGYELLNALIIARGVLSIQQGENPNIILFSMVSMLGEQYLDRFDCKITTRESLEKELAVKLEKYKDKKGLKDSESFEELITNTHKNSLSYILRRVGPLELSYALKGCGYETIEYVVENMSLRFANLVLQDMECQTTLRSSVIINAQNDMLEIVKKLEEAGEIIMYRKEG